MGKCQVAQSWLFSNSGAFAFALVPAFGSPFLIEMDDVLKDRGSLPISLRIPADAHQRL
jgi:hypothetical protein